MASTTETKVLTENPLLDEIIWNAKMLARGVILKDQEQADKYETLESSRNGDTLIAVNDGYIKFDNFVYTEEMLLRIPSISEEQAAIWGADNSLIPIELKPQLQSLAVAIFNDNYVELNHYYRKLSGLPDYDPTGVWQGLWIDRKEISLYNSTPTVYVAKPDFTEEELLMDEEDRPDYQLIHKLGLGDIEVLDTAGALDNIINDETLPSSLGIEPSMIEYMAYLGSKSINTYEARKAPRYAIIYCPSADSIEVEKRFRDLLEANRLMYLYTHYSEAYKYKSVYYERIMMILIILQTVVDMIVELPDYLIRRDIFDIRTCRYIFESNGVAFFPDIPIKYQIALVKNLNKLIKFKSTDRCIVDICSIFGCENIQVFKYYILKERKVNGSTELDYINKSKSYIDSDGNVITEPDNDENYDLKFVKVPIQEGYDDYIRGAKNIYDYDSLTVPDAYWNGDREYEDVLHDIKDMDFTILRSKYYSVEALVDMTEKAMQLVYFMNIILHNDIDRSALEVRIPSISTKKKFELVDVIATLYALGYFYYGAEDRIVGKNQKEVLTIQGFNYEADLLAIGEEIYKEWGNYVIKDSHWDSLKKMVPHIVDVETEIDLDVLEEFAQKTLEEMGVDEFKVPNNGKILSFDELMNIYTTNRKIYEHVMYQLLHVNRKEVYDAYKKIYYSLFTMRNTQEYFTIGDEIAETYTDFLSSKDGVLGAFLIKIKSIQSVSDRQTACINAIQSITTYLKDYISEDLFNYSYIFDGLPSVSMDFIKRYVQEVIDFFKSFKIFTHNTSITYLFADRWKNWVAIIDWLRLNLTLAPEQVIDVEDFISDSIIDMAKNDSVGLIEKIYLDVNRLVRWYYEERGNFNLTDTTGSGVKDYDPFKNILFTDLIDVYKSVFDAHDNDLSAEYHSSDTPIKDYNIENAKYPYYIPHENSSGYKYNDNIQETNMFDPVFRLIKLFMVGNNDKDGNYEDIIKREAIYRSYKETMKEYIRYPTNSIDLEIVPLMVLVYEYMEKHQLITIKEVPSIIDVLQFNEGSRLTIHEKVAGNTMGTIKDDKYNLIDKCKLIYTVNV